MLQLVEVALPHMHAGPSNSGPELPHSHVQSYVAKWEHVVPLVEVVRIWLYFVMENLGVTVVLVVGVLYTGFVVAQLVYCCRLLMQVQLFAPASLRVHMVVVIEVVM